MNIKDTLSSIVVNARIIKNQEKLIEEKRKEFEQSIEPSKHIILAHKDKNRELFNKVVKIKFDDLLKEIAQEWGCEVNKIRIINGIGTSFCRNPHERKSEDKIVKGALRRVGNILTFYLISPDGKSVAVSQKLKGQLLTPQTDGRMLMDHIQLNEVDRGEHFVRYEMSLDDPHCFIFEKTLNELIYIDQEGKVHVAEESCGRLILKIAMEDVELDNESEME